MSFGSHLLQPQPEDFIATKRNERLQRNALQEVQREYPKTHAVVEVQITPICFNTVKMQFRTLGIIQKANRDNDQRMWWQLTALGERNLSNVMSVRRVTSRPTA